MWIVLLLILITLLIAIIFRLNIQIKSINKQMEKIDKHNTNQLITRDFSSKEINYLVCNINNLYEKLRKQSVSYAKKDNELKETITNISHDIRTPLTSLSGYFQLLEEANSEEDKERYCFIIKERIKCLKDMLEELFTYVKLQNSDYVLDEEEVNVKEKLCNCILSFYEELKKQNIEPVISIPDEEKSVILNNFALDRVFQNIVKNSLEHGCEKLKVELYYKDSNEIFLSFANKIKENYNIDVSRIFDRFYKEDRSRSRNSTGLGLSIAHDLVVKLGGTMEAFVEENNFKIIIKLTSK